MASNDYGEAWNKRYRVRYRLLLLWYSYSSKGAFFMSSLIRRKNWARSRSRTSTRQGSDLDPRAVQAHGPRGRL